MPLQIVRNDITRMRVDAIVNAANPSLLGGGGVDGAIHRAAGPRLLEECRTLGGCKTGEAKATRAYNLPCRHVIHTVGPVWQGGGAQQRALLAACYRHSLELAAQLGCRSIAFPLISSGAYGCPKDIALRIATTAVSDYLINCEDEQDMTVYIALFTRESVHAGSKLFADIRQYIDDCYVQERLSCESMRIRRALEPRETVPEDAWTDQSIDEDIWAEESVCAPCGYEADFLSDEACCASVTAAEPLPPRSAAPAWTLEDALSCIDESFSKMLRRLIQEKGIKNAECYKRANIDKKLFSKIINNDAYKPRKATALALAISLRLSLEETRELLMKAGLALSHSEKFDIIVEFFIKKEQYDIFEINEILYEFDQPLLGGVIA